MAKGTTIEYDVDLYAMKTKTKTTNRRRSAAKAKKAPVTMRFYESVAFKLMQDYATATIRQNEVWERARRNNSYREERWIYEDAKKRTAMARNAILEHVRLFAPKPEVCPTCGHCKTCGH